jgi:exosortase
MHRRRLAKELGLATGVAGLLALSPLTGDERPRAILLASLAGAALFGFRAWRKPWAGEAEDAGLALGSLRPPPLVVLPCAALWLALFWPTLSWLWRHWTASVWINDHGIFMPPLMAYLALRALRDDPDASPRSSSAGFFWLVPSVALAVADLVLGTHTLGVIALVGSLTAFALLFLGAERTRRLRVPLALGLLMVPLPTMVATTIGLRHLTAAGVMPLLAAIGVPALREGTVIQLAGARSTFVVANACSGVAALYAASAMAILLACYAGSHAKRLAFLAAAAPLALGANTLRVFALILMSTYLGEWVMHSPLHPATGVLTFVVPIAGLLWIAGPDPLGERPAAEARP